MDSWSPDQLKIMKTGGNKKCCQYLSQNGIDKSWPIKSKYESAQAQRYKQVLKSEALGTPLPAAAPVPAARAPSAGAKADMSRGDPNGMERLRGESDAEYVARQTRLKEEARARMAAKFGNSSGFNGNSRMNMGGVGSNSSYNPRTGSYGNSSGTAMNANMDDLVAGIGSAFSTLGNYTMSAAEMAKMQAQAAMNDPQIHNATSSVTKGASSMWGSLSASVRAFADPDGNDDGLAALRRKAQKEQSTRGSSNSSVYSGFGSDNYASSNSMKSGISHSAQSNSWQSSSSVPAPAPAPVLSSSTYHQTPSKTTSADSLSASVAEKNKEKMGSSDDFFASFGT